MPDVAVKMLNKPNRFKGYRNTLSDDHSNTEDWPLFFIACYTFKENKSVSGKQIFPFRPYSQTGVHLPAKQMLLNESCPSPL